MRGRKLDLFTLSRCQIIACANIALWHRYEALSKLNLGNYMSVIGLLSVRMRMR